MHEMGIALFCLGVMLLALSPVVSVLTRIAEGIESMADLEAQAIADLNAGVDAVIVVLKSLAAAAATAVPPVDHSAAIESAVKKLSDAVAAVSAPAPAGPTMAVPGAVAAPAPAAPAA